MRFLKTSSVRGNSILRRFSVLYVLFGLVPFVLLFYLYNQYDEHGGCMVVSRSQMAWLIVCVAVASLVGFFGVRFMLLKFVVLADDFRKSLMGSIDKSVILELAREEGEVAELARSFGEVFTRLESNIRELEGTKRKLFDVVSKVSRALSSMESYELLMNLVLETAAEALGAQCGAVFVLDENGEFHCTASSGVKDTPEQELVAAARNALDWVKSERRLFVLPTVGSESSDAIFAAPLACAPLFSRGKLRGAVCLAGSAQGKNFAEDELKILSNLSYQIAIALENSQLAADMERTYLETMSALALAVEARDPCSRGHSDRVGEYSVQIASHMGLARSEIESLRDSAKLHDIGKIGIDDNILKKPGKLDDNEWEIMRKHPAIGEGIVKPLKTFGHLLDPIRHHHERLDGSGYPDGLGADSIPVGTRIMMVADVFDAITSDRPYRPAMSMAETRTEMDRLVAAGKVDEKVVAALFTLVDKGEIAP